MPEPLESYVALEALPQAADAGEQVDLRVQVLDEPAQRTDPGRVGAGKPIVIDEPVQHLVTGHPEEVVE